MRIDDLNRTPLAQSTAKTEQAAEKSAAEKSRIADGKDQVEVSDLAQALAPRDPARLEELRLAVESGKYEVPADVLARSIIDAHRKD